MSESKPLGLQSSDSAREPIGSLPTNVWISVKERLPARGEYVLWAGRGNINVDRIIDDEHPEDWFTHWQPLPDPPKNCG